MTKLLISLLMFLIAGGLFFGFTQPQYSATDGLKAQATQLDQILAEATEFQRLKSALISRYNALSPDQLTRLGKLLPDHVDNVRLILDVDSLASRNGLTLENVIINTTADTATSQDTSGALGGISEQRTPYGSLTLQFNTNGSYAQFQTFIQSLEQSLRLVDIVDLGVRAGSGSGDTGETNSSYAYTVKIRTYWLK